MIEGLIYNLCSVHGRIIIFLLVFVTPRDIHSWDLAIADEKGLSFFDLNGTTLFTVYDEMSHLDDLYMLTYDSLKEKIFFNVKNRDVDIFEFDIRKKVPKPLLASKQKHFPLGMSYDTLTETLFWTDGSGHTIWKTKSVDDESRFPEPVLTFKTDLPTGIAISVCKRLLFWTNINHLSASIDRSHLNGFNHTKIIVEDVFVPLAITVDEVYQKLYWTDDKEGIYFKIESSNFDGTDRKSVIHGTNQEPIGIIALNNAIYWTDTVQKSLWMHPLDSPKSEPEIFYKFRVTPYGITGFRPKRFECNSVLPPNKVSKIEEPKSVPKNNSLDSYCLNSGNFTENRCLCKMGFSGFRCETSECHNFCLNDGKCFLNNIGRPRCLCPEGRSGNRCQIDVCLGHCLNGGKCYTNNSVPSCECEVKFSGPRCEIFETLSRDRIEKYAINNIASSFKSTLSNDEDVLQVDPVSKPSHCSESETQSIIIVALVCVEALTMLVVVLLVRNVCVLRRRPRIKKRIIINKGIKSQTPMTARPHLGPSEQCEITIENCCNMNICETPCFEPNLRSSRISTKLLSKKTEDKKNLLKSMDGEFENSDLLYS